MIDDFLRDRRDYPDRVYVEERGGFTNVEWGESRWCFPTERELTRAEQRTLDALLKIWHAQ